MTWEPNSDSHAALCAEISALRQHYLEIDRELRQAQVDVGDLLADWRRADRLAVAIATVRGIVAAAMR
jgi:hypothetical protein